MSLPKIRSYGRYSSENYGAHCLVVEVGTVTLWFSYQTCIAFQVDGRPMVVHKNDWSTTTGKHISWLDGGSAGARKRRVSGSEFQLLYEEQILPLVDPANVGGPVAKL